MPGFAAAILSALDGGFWPRLMGYISAAKIPTATRVAQLALDYPTSVRLSIPEAGRLLALGIDARRAAKSWMANNPLSVIRPPVVPIPPSPNIDGAEPGKYEAGLIAHAPGMGVEDYNVIFSITDPCGPGGRFQDCVEALDRWIQENGSSTPGLTQSVRDVLADWTHGNQTALLPNWFAERYLR